MRKRWVDPPGRFDLDVHVRSEQRVQAGGLGVGEQFDAGVQDLAGAVEKVAFAAAVPVDLLLDAPAALVQGVPGKSYDVEGVQPDTAGVAGLGSTRWRTFIGPAGPVGGVAVGRR